MARQLVCRDVGMDCDYVVRGENDEEVMRAGAEHGRSAHNKTHEYLGVPGPQQKSRGLLRDA